jgi:methylated-DNA-[protein]-cysteine S-methyltransferase
MQSLQSITTSTPDGDFHMIIDQDDIVRASGFGSIDDLATRLPDELRGITIEPVADHPYQSHITDYFNGDASALDRIAHGQTGTEFQQKVWQAISAIGHGKTLSYKQLADASGNPAAIRAAGTICGLNKLVLLVPCHRVLKSDGSIGSYLYGPTIKESLLRREGAI